MGSAYFRADVDHLNGHHLPTHSLLLTLDTFRRYPKRKNCECQKIVWYTDREISDLSAGVQENGYACTISSIS